MSFFKEFKEDLSQAVNELLPEEQLAENEAAQAAVEDEADDSIDLDDFDNLLKAVGGAEELPVEEPAEAVEEVIEAINEVEEAAQKEAVPEIIEPAAAEPTAEEAVPVEAVPKAAAPKTPEASSEISEESAVITKGTSIKGDIDSNGSMEIIGTVTGNVSCSGKLVITGKVVGNSRASEIFADSAKIEGEVISEGTVKIAAGSVIIGNVTATSAVIAGAVNGNIDVKGPVIIDSSAVVMGDIKSRSVQINNGAVIEGFCSQCYSDINVKSFFEENK